MMRNGSTVLLYLGKDTKLFYRVVDFLKEYYGMKSMSEVVRFLVFDNFNKIVSTVGVKVLEKYPDLQALVELREK